MGKLIVIGSDKSGFPLKEAVKEWLSGQGYEVKDVGTQDIDNFMPYYEVAPIVARKIQSGEAERGALFCGTGMGVAIVANKFKGVYAAVVNDMYEAQMSAVVNKANVLALGGWVSGPEKAIAMLKTWLNTSFGEGFPAERIEFLSNAFAKVQAIEEDNFK